MLARGYEIFEENASAHTTSGSKQARVREHILRHAQPAFTLGDLRAALPGVSSPTIKIVLAQLRTEGLVELHGMGRSAAYLRVPPD